MGRTNPKLWEKAKTRAKAKMGGKHSARAMQLAAKIYKDLGGSYSGGKTKAQKSMTKWTNKSGVLSLVSLLYVALMPQVNATYLLRLLIVCLIKATKLLQLKSVKTLKQVNSIHHNQRRKSNARYSVT